MFTFFNGLLINLSMRQISTVQRDATSNDDPYPKLQLGASKNRAVAMKHSQNGMAWALAALAVPATHGKLWAQPTAPGFKSVAREYACREAIRQGEREALTAKQPQGRRPVCGEKEDAVFTSCFVCFQKNLQARKFSFRGDLKRRRCSAPS